MSLEHAQPGEVIDIRPLGNLLFGSRTAVLIKTKTLEVMRLIVPAGKEIHGHKVAGELTVQCLEGRVEIDMGDEPRDLSAGQMLYLQSNQVHSVRGLEDSSLLLTIHLHH